MNNLLFSVAIAIIWYLVLDQVLLFFTIIILRLVSKKNKKPLGGLYLIQIKNWKLHLFFVLLITLGTAYFLLNRVLFKSIDSGLEAPAIEESVAGRLDYSIPSIMEIGKNYPVIAMISENLAMNDSIWFIENRLTHYKIDTIQIASRMKLDLIDPEGGRNFQISKLSTEEQMIDMDTPTKWEWVIQPKRRGKKVIVLRATVVLWSDIGDREKDIPIYKNEIHVVTTPSNTVRQFLIDYWQFVISVIIIPGLIWLLKRVKEKRKRPKKIGF